MREKGEKTRHGRLPDIALRTVVSGNSGREVESKVLYCPYKNADDGTVVFVSCKGSGRSSLCVKRPDVKKIHSKDLDSEYDRMSNEVCNRTLSTHNCVRFNGKGPSSSLRIR